MSSLSSFRPTLMGAVLLPTLLLLGACQAPPMDEQEAATADAQKAVEEASAPATSDTVGKATEAPPVGNCDATQVQSLIGQSWSAGMEGEAQQAAAAKQVRVLHPNDVTTMEFLGERLNIELDDKDVVTGVRCG